MISSTLLCMSEDWDHLLNSLAHDPYLGQVENFMPSAWIGHAPFLKFLIREQKPSVIVELGVHNGFSYFVGCQSILENGLGSRAYAIDHWLGDSQAGIFDKTVYEGVVEINRKYESFSQLLRMTFTDGLKEFVDSSIDLLHIDGYHSYESVRSDFETWLPKMSENGIVLLHDVFVRRNSFGVFKFWKELKEKYSTIEFVGSHGLGVIFLGKCFGMLEEIRQIVIQHGATDIQGVFGSISDDVIQSSRNAQLENLQKTVDGLVVERDGLVVERDGLVVERDGLVVERDGLVVERDGLVVERDGMLNSTTWKLAKFINIVKKMFLLLRTLLFQPIAPKQPKIGEQ